MFPRQFRVRVRVRIHQCALKRHILVARSAPFCVLVDHSDATFRVRVGVRVREFRVRVRDVRVGVRVRVRECRVGVRVRFRVGRPPSGSGNSMPFSEVPSSKSASMSPVEADIDVT